MALANNNIKNTY